MSEQLEKINTTFSHITDALGSLTGLERCVDAGSPPDVLKRYIAEARRHVAAADKAVDAICHCCECEND